MNESAISAADAGTGIVRGCGYPGLVSWGAGKLWSVGYREWLPPVELRSALACLWVSVTPEGTMPSVSAVLPDGCTDLIWQSGRGAFVAGPDTGPVPTQTPGSTVLVGARFWPGAGGPAFGLPLTALRDQRVDLIDCLPALARQLPADLTPDQALKKVTGLSAQLVTTSPPDRLVRQAICLLTAGRTSLADLCPTLAVSERQLRRRFDETVGYGPKTLQRVLRFRQVVDELFAEPAVDLADLAWRTGYADQAHLTRETTRMAGVPPTALAKSFQSR